MSIHIASINGLNLLPADYSRAKARDGIIRQMADHLVAGATGTLDLNSDFDVLRYLMEETPERYRWATIKPHVDAALAEARQTIAVMRAMQEGKGL